MIRELLETKHSRIVAMAVALAAIVLLALTIAPGTSQAAITPPTVAPDDSAGEATVTEITGGKQYTATANSGWTFDHWVIQPGEGEPYWSSNNPLTVDEHTYATTAVFKEGTGKQDWTGAKTVESKALPGGTGTVVVASYLPTDCDWSIPQETVTVSDPDKILADLAVDEATNSVSYKLVDDATKAGKSATISGTVVSDKYNDFTGSVIVTVETPAPVTHKVSVASSTTEGGTVIADKQEAVAGDTVTLTVTPVEGYEFTGWTVNPESVTITDNKFTMPDGDVSVKANFAKKATPVTTYSITFDANGGTGAMDALTADAGATVTLTANAFKRDGYSFNGWNTAKDGSGTAYSDKASVTVSDNMTLYAQWKANSSTSNKSNVAKTGDSLIPLTISVVAIAILATGVLVFVRRKAE